MPIPPSSTLQMMAASVAVGFVQFVFVEVPLVRMYVAEIVLLGKVTEYVVGFTDMLRREKAEGGFLSEQL